MEALWVAREDGSGRTRAPETAPNCRATAAPTAGSRRRRPAGRAPRRGRAARRSARRRRPAGGCRGPASPLLQPLGHRARAARRPPPRSAPRSARHPRAAPASPSSASRSSPVEQVDLVPRLDPRRRLLFGRARATSSTSSTSSRCASLSGCAMSRTWTMRSADATSSSVARKAATSSVGRSETKPTVSDRIALSKPGSADLAHGRVERREQQILGDHRFARSGG